MPQYFERGRPQPFQELRKDFQFQKYFLKQFFQHTYPTPLLRQAKQCNHCHFLLYSLRGYLVLAQAH